VSLLGALCHTVSLFSQPPQSDSHEGKVYETTIAGALLPLACAILANAPATVSYKH
jgi:hypothetical protein